MDTKPKFLLAKRGVQFTQSQNSKHDQKPKSTVTSNLLSTKTPDSEGGPISGYRALELRLREEDPRALLCKDKSDNIPITASADKTQLGQGAESVDTIQAYEAAQILCTMRGQPAQDNATPAKNEEIGFKVICTSSLDSPLAHVQPPIEYSHASLHFPPTTLSYLRHRPYDESLSRHERPVNKEQVTERSNVSNREVDMSFGNYVEEGGDAQRFSPSAIDNRLSTTLAIRTSKPSQESLDVTGKRTMQSVTESSLKSPSVPNHATTTGFITTFNHLVGDLLRKTTQGDLIEEMMQSHAIPLAHQATSYLILSNLGISGIEENQTLLCFTNGVLSSQLHQEIMPSLELTAIQNPFDSWIIGLENLQPTKLETRVQITSRLMSICRLTLENLEKVEKRRGVHGKTAQYLECLLRVGHDNLRMQARRYQATLPYPEISDGFLPPPRRY